MARVGAGGVWGFTVPSSHVCLKLKLLQWKQCLKRHRRMGKNGEKREREKKGKEEGRILCLVSNVH